MDPSHPPSQSSGTLLSPSTYSSSSKSQSDKTSIVAAEQDFSKSNDVTPIDMECIIQAERITKMLDEAIAKTKLALCLPNLMREYNSLNSTLTHMDDLNFIFQQYDNPLFSRSFMNIAVMQDLKGGDVSLKNRLNPEMGLMIHIMSTYPGVQLKVENMVAEMRMAYENDTKPKLLSLEFLLALEHFRDLMVKQMATTAAEELSLKLNIRKLENSNVKLKKTIQETSTCLTVEMSNFEELMEKMSRIIAELEAELQITQVAAGATITKKIIDSERQMVLLSRKHKVNKELLHEEDLETKESYEELLHKDVIEEKKQRARRFKVETQLKSWVQKYDSEMNDKQMELEELNNKYEEEESIVEELEKTKAEQDKEYEPQMEEKEKEYHEEMARKLEEFIAVHAARVIQNAWRQILANRTEKKKLKKLIKKLEAEKAARELLEEKAARKAAAEARRAQKEAKAAEKAAKQAEKEARAAAKKEQEKQ